VMAEVKRLIDWLNKSGIARFNTEQGLVGGSAYDAHKVSITDATMEQAKAADAVAGEKQQAVGRHGHHLLTYARSANAPGADWQAARALGK